MMTRTREATENLLEQVRGDDGIWTADTSFTRFFKAPDGRETAHTVGCSAFQLPAASVSPTFWTDIAGDGHGPIGRSSQLSTLLANEFGVAVVEGDENTAIGTGGRSDRLRFDDSLPPLVSNFVRRTALPQEGDFFGDWAVTVLRYPVPLFGSPPSEITPLRELAKHGPVAVVLGTAVATDRPVIALVSGATGALIWFAKPVARIARRSVARRLADRLGEELLASDVD